MHWIMIVKSFCCRKARQGLPVAGAKGIVRVTLGAIYWLTGGGVLTGRLFLLCLLERIIVPVNSVREMSRPYQWNFKPFPVCNCSFIPESNKSCGVYLEYVDILF